MKRHNIGLDQTNARGDAELAHLVEWGGPVWRQQVQRGLDWLGDIRGLRVLEIGTRYGGMATLLAMRGARVTALDVNEAPFDRAREVAAEHGVSEQITFDVYSGDPRDFPVGYDIIFSKSTLVLMNDLGSAVRAIAASLGPGGRLLIVENARGPLPLHLGRMLLRRSLRPHGAAYFTPGSVETIATHLDVQLERWTTAPPTVLVGAVKGTGGTGAEVEA